MSSNNIRILLALGMFASVIFAPPWFAGIFAVALSLRWRAWEVIAAGMVMDFLWMPVSVSPAPVLELAKLGLGSFDAIPFATIISIIVVFCLEPLRRQLLLGPLIE